MQSVEITAEVKLESAGSAPSPASAASQNKQAYSKAQHSTWTVLRVPRPSSALPPAGPAQHISASEHQCISVSVHHISCMDTRINTNRHTQITDKQLCLATSASTGESTPLTFSMEYSNSSPAEVRSLGQWGESIVHAVMQWCSGVAAASDVEEKRKHRARVTQRQTADSRYIHLHRGLMYRQVCRETRVRSLKAMGAARRTTRREAIVTHLLTDSLINTTV